MRSSVWLLLQKCLPFHFQGTCHLMTVISLPTAVHDNHSISHRMPEPSPETHNKLQRLMRHTAARSFRVKLWEVHRLPLPPFLTGGLRLFVRKLDWKSPVKQNSHLIFFHLCRVKGKARYKTRFYTQVAAQESTRRPVLWTGSPPKPVKSTNVKKKKQWHLKKKRFIRTTAAFKLNQRLWEYTWQKHNNMEGKW